MDHEFLRVNLSKHVSATIDSLDPALADKVREIIERQWGKRLADVKDLSIEQFYERRVLDGRVSYRPVNRYAIQALFRTARVLRRVTFSLTAQQVNS